MTIEDEPVIEKVEAQAPEEALAALESQETVEELAEVAEAETVEEAQIPAEGVQVEATAETQPVGEAAEAPAQAEEVPAGTAEAAIEAVAEAAPTEGAEAAKPEAAEVPEAVETAEAEASPVAKPEEAEKPQRLKKSLALKRKKKRQYKAKVAPAPTEAAPEKGGPSEVFFSEKVTVKSFAEQTGLKSNEVIRALMQFGMMVNMNQLLDQSTVEQLGQKFGIVAKFATFEEVTAMEEQVPERKRGASRSTSAPIRWRRTARRSSSSIRRVTKPLPGCGPEERRSPTS
ncbi:MAG: translation initiation factor IF-2 N-terminal domain-containing protein [Acidobacteriota bacterium]